MRFTFCIAVLALVARSNSSTANATRRTDVGGSAEAAAAAEGRLVVIGNKSYVRGWSGSYVGFRRKID